MPAATGGPGPRLAAQRQRRGLSQARTAGRAGRAASYLQYPETSTTAEPGPQVPTRPADTLGTTTTTRVVVAGRDPRRRLTHGPVPGPEVPPGNRDLCP